MGRRALPKMKPEVDYTSHFLTQDQLDPWQPEQWFGRAAPLEVEIGSGKGLFLQNFAPRTPEHNFLGMELAKQYAHYTAYRMAKLGIPNVRVSPAHALEVFHAVVPANSLAAIHIYFPDPWWKARHKKRRVLNEESVRDYQRALAPGGILHFWTDVEEYYHTGVELLTSHTQLTGPHPVPEREPDHPLDYRTHRERRVRLEGLPVYRSEFHKP